MRLIATDRFYTSVALAVQMLPMGFYSVGTVQADRLGLPVSTIGKKKKGVTKKNPPKSRPAHIERCTSEVIEHKQIPGFRALRWWDNEAVYMLASGGSVALVRVVCRDKRSGGQVEVACPCVLKDYHTLMGGVGVHSAPGCYEYLRFVTLLPQFCELGGAVQICCWCRKAESGICFNDGKTAI